MGLYVILFNLYYDTNVYLLPRRYKKYKMYYVIIIRIHTVVIGSIPNTNLNVFLMVPYSCDVAQYIFFIVAVQIVE